MKDKLLLNEIFVSIQGEGINVGLPFIFVRFHGCNLRCAWCDTAYTWETSSPIITTVDEVVEEIKKLSEEYNLKRVCITGGEPLMQMECFMALVQYLYTLGFFIAVETNGTFYPINTQQLVHHWTVSPKYRPVNEIYFSIAHEFKYIIEPGFDFDSITFTRNVILQPVDNNHRMIQLAYEQVLKHSQWRLGLQLHKIVEVK